MDDVVRTISRTLSRQGSQRLEEEEDRPNVEDGPNGLNKRVRGGLRKKALHVQATGSLLNSESSQPPMAAQQPDLTNFREELRSNIAVFSGDAVSDEVLDSLLLSSGGDINCALNHFLNGLGGCGGGEKKTDKASSSNSSNSDESPRAGGQCSKSEAFGTGGLPQSQEGGFGAESQAAAWPEAQAGGFGTGVSGGNSFGGGWGSSPLPTPSPHFYATPAGFASIRMQVQLDSIEQMLTLLRFSVYLGFSSIFCLLVVPPQHRTLRNAVGMMCNIIGRGYHFVSEIPHKKWISGFGVFVVGFSTIYQWSMGRSRNEIYIDVIEELSSPKPSEKATVKGTVLTKTSFPLPLQASFGMKIPSHVNFPKLIPSCTDQSSRTIDVEFPGGERKISPIIEYDMVTTELPFEIRMQGDISTGWTIAVVATVDDTPLFSCSKLTAHVACPNGIGGRSNAKVSDGSVSITYEDGKNTGCEWQLKSSRWKLKDADGKRFVTLHLGTASSKPESLLLTFEMLHYTVSGARVKFCKFNAIRPVKWIRYLAKGSIYSEL